MSEEEKKESKKKKKNQYVIESNSGEQYLVDERKVRLKLISGEEIFGNVNISAAGVKRLSEMFVSQDPNYIVVYDCTGGITTKNWVLFVNKAHILWAEPLEF